MKTLAFKVVRKEDGKFLSYTMSLSHMDRALEYKPGEITRVKGGHGPMACFSTLENALEFLRRDFGHLNYQNCHWERYGIFLCEIEPASEKELWTDINRPFSVDHIPGTVTAWSVRLLAEITYQPHFETLWKNSLE